MARAYEAAGSKPVAPPYKSIARRIGMRLRQEFERPEADPLPSDHVDLLLRLRHKERDRSRREV